MKLISEFPEQTHFATASPVRTTVVLLFPKISLANPSKPFFLPRRFELSSRAPRSRGSFRLEKTFKRWCSRQQPAGRRPAAPSPPACPASRAMPRRPALAIISPPRSLACSFPSGWTGHRLLRSSSRTAPSLPPQSIPPPNPEEGKGGDHTRVPTSPRPASHPGDNRALGQGRAERRQICRLRSRAPDPLLSLVMDEVN